MEEVDIYSNMLYVMDKKAKLGKLAHEYAEIDRNRAEVCCLIGKLARASKRVMIADDRQLLFVQSGPYKGHHVLQTIINAESRIPSSMDADGTRVCRAQELSRCY